MCDECRSIWRGDEGCTGTVKVLTRDGDVKTLTKDELELGYRTSVIAKKDYIVLSAVIRLENGKKRRDQSRYG